jgi:hypothetical protein
MREPDSLATTSERPFVRAGDQGPSAAADVYAFC